MNNKENKIKVTHRIPTSQYAYIEFEKEYDSVEDSIADHKHISTLYEEKGDLTHREWVKVRNKMLSTGELDVNLIDRLSATQRWWINETKLALSAFEAEDPIIE